VVRVGKKHTFRHSTVRAALSVYDATVSELLQYELKYHRNPRYTSTTLKTVAGVTNNLDNITKRGVCMTQGHPVWGWSFESALEVAFLELMGGIWDIMYHQKWDDPQPTIDRLYDVRLPPPSPKV